MRAVEWMSLPSCVECDSGQTHANCVEIFEGERLVAQFPKLCNSSASSVQAALPCHKSAQVAVMKNIISKIVVPFLPVSKGSPVVRAFPLCGFTLTERVNCVVRKSEPTVTFITLQRIIHSDGDNLFYFIFDLNKFCLVLVLFSLPGKSRKVDAACDIISLM